MSKLSIIIVNWNTCELLRSCLYSIFRYCGDLAPEIIVSDNASTDGSVEMVKSEFPMVMLLENRENLGFGSANNRGLQKATGDMILFLNPDTQFIDASLKKTIAFYQQRLEAGFVGCRLLNADHSLQPSAFQFPGLLAHLAVNLGLHIFLPTVYRKKIAFLPRDHDNTFPVAWMRGAFLLINKEKLHRIGIFDEAIYMYGEDLDLCLRARQTGLTNYYFADARIVHLGNQAGEIRFGDQRLSTIYRSFDYVAKKHFGKDFAARYELITSITSFLKVMQCNLLLLFSGVVKRKLIRQRRLVHDQISRINWRLWRENL